MKFKNTHPYTLLFFGMAFFLTAISVQAQTNWLAAPISGDWNTSGNWDSGVPNSNSAFATLGSSNVTSINFSGDVDLDGLVFKAGASTYTITTNQQLFLHGLGLSNNSGTAQNIDNTKILYFTGTSGASNVSITNNGDLYFSGTSTAANSSITNVSGKGLVFLTNGSAGSSTITNNGNLSFLDTSKGGSSAIANNGYLAFNNGSTAQNANITNNGVSSFLGVYNSASLGAATVVNGNELHLYDTSKAGSASVTNSGHMEFHGDSSAENSTITNLNGDLTFGEGSSAGNATVMVSNFTAVYFYGDSTGGTSKFTIDVGGGLVDISTHTGAVTVGSIAGGGGVLMGGNDFGVGAGDFSAVFSGNLNDDTYSSSFAKIGTGSLTLSGTNTYDGGTSIVAGTLRVDGTGTLGTGAVVNNAVLDISGHTGAVTLASLAGSGFVSLGSNNLMVGNNDQSATVTGVISDGGYAGGTGGSLTKEGLGVLALTGANSYSGGTTLISGTMDIQNAAALGSGSVLAQGGNLSIANSPMTLNIGGDYTQGALGGLSLSLDGAASKLSVAGAANLAGTLLLSSFNSFVPNINDTFSVLSAGGGINGRFDALLNFITGARLYPIYTSTDLQLLAIQPSFAALGLTSNQVAVGTWLDNILLDSRLDTFIQSQGGQTALVLQSDYKLLAPEELAPIFQLGYSVSRGHAAVIEHRLSGLSNGAPSGTGTARFQEGPMLAADLPIDQLWDMASVKPSNPAPKEDSWGVFLEGEGDFGTIGSDSNAVGYQFTIKGITAGADYRFSKNFMGGLLLAYDQMSSTSAGGGSVEVSGGQAGFYGGLRTEGFHLESLIEMGIHSYKTNRLGYLGSAPGVTQGTQFSGFLGAGYDWKMGQVVMGPYALGQYTLVQIDSFSEQGSALPLYYPAQGQSSLRSELGIGFKANLKLGTVTMTPSLNGGWGHDYQGTRDSLSAGLGAGSETFAVQGPATGAESVVLGGGIDFQFARGLSAHVQYQGKLARTNYDSQGFFGGMTVGF